jgi:hypothetical protein
MQYTILGDRFGWKAGKGYTHVEEDETLPRSILGIARELLNALWVATAAASISCGLGTRTVVAAIVSVLRTLAFTDAVPT